MNYKKMYEHFRCARKIIRACIYDNCVHVYTGMFLNFFVCSLLSHELKGTLSTHKKFSYMMHMDPLSTKKPLKNSSEFFNSPKNALKVLFSMLNRAENASMAPHYHPRMRQWLQNFIPIGINGSRFSSLLASMAPVGSKLAGSSLEPLPYPGIAIWSHCPWWGWKSGAIDADWDEILEPLTHSWMIIRSHWHILGSV